MHRFLIVIGAGIITALLVDTFLLRPPLPEGIIFEEDYAGRNFSGEWDTRGLCCTHSIKLVTSPVRSGKYAARFQINYLDPMVYNGKRAELVRWHKDVGRILGADEWYGFSIYLPSGYAYDSDKDVLVQWHARKDTGEAPRYPPLHLDTQKGAWQFVTTYSDERIQKSQGNVKTLWRDDYQAGRWTDWVVHVKWDYRNNEDGGKGFVRIWQRVGGGQWNQLVDYHGPNCYNDAGNVYFQWGMYKPDWNKCKAGDQISDCAKADFENRFVYNDQLRIAGPGAFSEQFDKVAPNSFLDFLKKD